MIKEITKLVLGIIIVGGAVYAGITNSAAFTPLLGVAGIIIGYYYKDVAGSVYAAFKK